MADDILTISCDISATLSYLDRTERDLLKSIEKGMAVVVLDVLGEASRNAPVDTGDLRGSGTARINGSPVGHTTNDAGSTGFVRDNFMPTGLHAEVKGQVGFDKEYAMVQHEDMTLNHPRGGKAKFLEDVIKEKSGQYENIIGSAMRGEL